LKIPIIVCKVHMSLYNIYNLVIIKVKRNKKN